MVPLFIIDTLYIHTYLHTYIYIYIYVHRYMQTCSFTSIYTCIFMIFICTKPYRHTYIHTYIHAYIQAGSKQTDRLTFTIYYISLLHCCWWSCCLHQDAWTRLYLPEVSKVKPGGKGGGNSGIGHKPSIKTTCRGPLCSCL